MDGTLDFSTINENQIKICFDLININPKNVDAWVKLTQIYLRNQDFKMANICINTAFECDEEINTLMLSMKAYYHLKVGEFNEARELYLYLISFHKNLLNNITPEDINYSLCIKKIRTFRFNLSEIEFHLGNKIKGFELYEYRDKKLQENFIDKADIIALSNVRELTFDEFKNKEFKKIIVLSEQGYGDQIMILRYLKPLMELGFIVKYVCNKNLIDLFRSYSDLTNIKIIEKINYEDIKNSDRIIWSMSLPLFFYKLNKKNCKSPKSPTISSNLNVNLKNKKSINIGICWKGNPKNIRDKERSIELKLFENLFSKKTVNFFTLQKEISTEERKFLNKYSNVIDYSNNLKNFKDTYLLMKNLQLIITVDTSLLHLAGSSDIKTVALLPYVPDPRWSISEDDFWYKNIKFLRQSKLNDWSQPFERLTKIIKELPK